MFKEFWCPENTEKVLGIHYFSMGRPKITKGLMVDLSWKTIEFKQQMEFQSLKIVQDFKKVYLWVSFFCPVYLHKRSMGKRLKTKSTWRRQMREIRTFSGSRWCIIISTQQVLNTFKPHHEKTCLCHMRTTKAQISLRICAVWSAPLFFTA